MRLSLLSMIMMGLALSSCSNLNGTQQSSNQAQKTIKTAATQSQQPLKNPLAVSLYPAGKPSKPFTVLGSTTVSKYNMVGNKRQEALIHDAMRTKAASMGGDAIINIKRDDKTVSGTVIAYQPRFNV